MFRFGLLVLLISADVITGDDVTNGTELVMTFLIHRHGDRTPVESTLWLSPDPEALEALVEPYGYGQLTKAGKQRAYQLGQYIKERYSELISAQYNRSEVYIRSTDYTRTKKTILSALAAIYPATENQRWSEQLDWEPVPYTTLPVKYDFNTANLNCPKFIAAYYALFLAPAPKFTVKYYDLLTKLSTALNFKVTAFPFMVALIYDVYVSQQSLGLPLDDDLQALFGELEEATSDTWEALFGVDKYIPLQAGTLLDEFYTYSKLAIAGEDTQRLRIYSAHDFNLFSFQAVTKVKRQGIPKYASAYSLEVRKVTSTGAYVVLPVYVSTPGKDVAYLQVEGCDLLCDYDQFVELTKVNALDIDSWRKQCGWTEKLVVEDPE